MKDFAVPYFLFSMCTLIIANPFVGEANAESKSANYNCTFLEMIKDWRAKFHTSSKGETDLVFPFGFAQVLHIQLVV